MKKVNALVRNKLSKEAIKEIKEQKDEDSEELNDTNIVYNNIPRAKANSSNSSLKLKKFNKLYKYFNKLYMPFNIIVLIISIIFAAHFDNVNYVIIIPFTSLITTTIIGLYKFFKIMHS